MMNAQLTHIVAQHRAVELRDAAADARRDHAIGGGAAEPRRFARVLRVLTLRRRPIAAPAAPAVSCD